MLKIPRRDYAAIRRHAEEAYPHECCGILVGTVEGDTRTVKFTVRCHNTHTDSPHNRYQIDPRELIRVQREARERGLEIAGFYHSHPDHPAQWSSIDLQEAHWVGCSYVITSVEHGKAGLTKSFVLAGTLEEDKALVEEQLAISD
ncbi:MAG TPA: M67 family metallopeptidase [Terriglobales bacterium]|nr:M67 family metallopeptidase [Terriglobales bacterium]